MSRIILHIITILGTNEKIIHIDKKTWICTIREGEYRPLARVPKG